MSDMPSSGSPILERLYAGDGEGAQRLAEAAELTIFEASALGRLERVHELLLLEGGFIDLWSPDGFTALHLAAFFGHREIAAELLRRGADVDAVARNPMGVQPIHSAAARGHTDVVRLLLEHGADPSARQEGGFAPIHAAAQSGDEDLYALLLEHGADPHAATEDGRTAADLRGA
jgi:uncharacterized protein